MAQHSDGWPGMIAKLASPVAEAQDRCVGELCKDFAAYTLCAGKGVAHLFLANMAKLPPLCARPFPSCAPCLGAGEPWLLAGRENGRHERATEVWSVWGQSTVGEDANEGFREEEERDDTHTHVSRRTSCGMGGGLAK